MIPAAPMAMMRRMICRAAFVALLLAPLLAAPLVPEAGGQAPGEIVARTELRGCAEPNDLPFSNDKGEGYENKTAELVGRELKLPVRFVFFPQVIGFRGDPPRARS